MKLFKNCKPKHNILGEGKSLRLGTLYGYRREEDPELRDEGEGTYHLELEFLEEITMSLKTANILLHPVFGFGSFEHLQDSGRLHCTGRNINIKSKADHTIDIQADSLSIRREVTDRFVFCMSISDSKPPLISGEYSEHWEIDNNKAEEFAKRIARALLEAITKKNDIVQGLSQKKPKTLQVIYKHSKVKYVPRTFKLSKINQDSIDSYAESLICMDFVKPKIYEPNSEYRFTFEIYSELGAHLPKSDAVLIDSAIVKDLATKPII